MGDVRIELGKSKLESRDLRDSNFGTGLLARGQQNPIRIHGIKRVAICRNQKNSISSQTIKNRSVWASDITYWSPAMFSSRNRNASLPLDEDSLTIASTQLQAHKACHVEL